ncbi:MAG TPA: hypothetical protein VHC97_13740 [Thermoanaerobaculia bacterium]|jgi:hypothetical protein|nr:hypothetical protein [Thermoanaerobaculia bacterium]
MWSIGIYTGPSPFELSPAPGIENPVLSAASVTDAPASFVADPFMLWTGGLWHLFFEVKTGPGGKGEIGWATSPDGLRWEYRRIVLAEPFHLSYPYVFAWDGGFFMVPETLAPGAVRLYRADPFPERWVYVRDLLPLTAADPSPFRFADRWWMFLCPRPYEHDTLALYHADDLEGPWREHARSPLLQGEPRISRPAGRVLVRDGGDAGIIRFAQDCRPRYGTRVRAFEVSRLTAEEYQESERGPVLEPPGSGWNGMRAHHVDAHPAPGGGWIACVDGFPLSEAPAG